MNTRTTALSLLGASLILAAAPVLAQDATTAPAPLDLQLKAQQHIQLRSQQPMDAADGVALQAQRQTQTRAGTAAGTPLRDGSHSGSGGQRRGMANR